MERLTKISAVGEYLPRKPLNLTHKSDLSESNLTEILEKLGKYEDAEEQGLLLRLPCKVGDTVYLIKNDGTIAERVADMMFIGVLWGEFGKTIFLTRAEAEAKLAEMEEKDGE